MTARPDKPDRYDLIKGSSIRSDRKPSPLAPQTADYIAAMTAELAQMAGAVRLDLLAYLLNLARLEAEDHRAADANAGSASTTAPIVPRQSPISG